MARVGIDIGSTSAKTVVLDEEENVLLKFVLPTGWSAFSALEAIKDELRNNGINTDEAHFVSTGYGRRAVEFADRNVTEITCHAKGAARLFGDGEMNVIDVGGQDTKVISVKDGRVEEFYMNDKCAAGTGKFVEVTAGRLAIPLDGLDSIAAKRSKEIEISSLCTVFAESEVVALVGRGVSKEDIAWGILNSVAKKVGNEYSRLHDRERSVYLTGGLCESELFAQLLGRHIGRDVISSPEARYAGALGAALMAK
jgi:predicted CoA-substrate-specific enzyme activase